jgi:methylthioribose-1-phosphate isomerase
MCRSTWPALHHLRSDHATGAEVEIEERGGDEVTHVAGEGGSLRITASPAANPVFDITPARLVTGYLTERGLLDAV